MRRCPLCDLNLVSVDYEGFTVLYCPQCKGHLASTSRVESIKCVAKKSQAELKTDISTHFTGSAEGKVRCPRCRMQMRKQAVHLPVIEVQIDVCRNCSLMWLDGGELALLQLKHEATSGFLDAQELKRRMQELESDPVRKQQFEKDLAKLPREKNPVAAGLEEAARDGLQGMLWSILECAARQIPNRK